MNDTLKIAFCAFAAMCIITAIVTMVYLLTSLSVDGTTVSLALENMSNCMAGAAVSLACFVVMIGIRRNMD